ncbi:ECF transporter S component [Clostridium fallax]|uniref:ECF transporter S component n=1 Tax=Clostridium fallax TaxID=1533 RepID=A0A1M4Z6K2_9CLOT|nr:ECF transporter S component [Clostridium fallax]SHF13615.1 Protein of unknown function [Clostridium fallax]SQB05873.1 Predicted membrane protein [Clostridium fallax]
MNFSTNKLVKAALFLALGIVIPLFFHLTNIPGKIFLPMHIPVLLCGFILGKEYGFIVGFITPLLNSFISGMPPLFPVAIIMAFELSVYGFFSGYLYKNKKFNIFISLIISMILGRLVSGILYYCLLSAQGNKYTLSIFVASSFIKPFMGIIIQLILIPIIVKALGNHKESIFLNE